MVMVDKPMISRPSAQTKEENCGTAILKDLSPNVLKSILPLGKSKTVLALERRE